MFCNFHVFQFFSIEQIFIECLLPGAWCFLGIWDMSMIKTKNFDPQVTIPSLEIFQDFVWQVEENSSFAYVRKRTLSIPNYLPSNPMNLLILKSLKTISDEVILTFMN